MLKHLKYDVSLIPGSSVERAHFSKRYFSFFEFLHVDSSCFQVQLPSICLLLSLICIVNFWRIWKVFEGASWHSFWSISEVFRSLIWARLVYLLRIRSATTTAVRPTTTMSTTESKNVFTTLPASISNSYSSYSGYLDIFFTLSAILILAAIPTSFLAQIPVVGISFRHKSFDYFACLCVVLAVGV